MKRITLHLPTYLLEWLETRSASRGQYPSQLLAGFIARDMAETLDRHWRALKAQDNAPGPTPSRPSTPFPLTDKPGPV